MTPHCSPRPAERRSATPAGRWRAVHRALSAAALLVAAPAFAVICTNAPAAGQTLGEKCYVDSCSAAGCHGPVPSPVSPINSADNATSRTEILPWGAHWAPGNQHAFTKAPSSMAGFRNLFNATDLAALAQYLGSQRDGNAATSIDPPPASLTLAPTAPGERASGDLLIGQPASRGWSLLFKAQLTGPGAAAFTLAASDASGADGAACLRIVRNLDGADQTWYAVRPGAACRLQLAYQRPAAPTQGLAAASATLSLQHNTSTGSSSVTVSAPAKVPTLNPQTLAFGTQTVGGLFPSRPVALTNSGSDPLLLAGIVVSGAGYSRSHDCPLAPATLAVGAGCTIAVSFIAQAIGANADGLLTVTSSAAALPGAVVLTGSGSTQTPPTLVWSPPVTRLDFGNAGAGLESAPLSANLVNNGPGGARISAIAKTGSEADEFALPAGAGVCVVGQLLFAGQGCRVDVTVKPVDTGARSASLAVDTGGVGPPTLPLSATGVPGIAPRLAPGAAAVAFGVIDVAAVSVAQPLLLSSTGSTTLHVASWSLAGPYLSRDGSCPPPPFSLRPGTGCTLALAFAPTTAGPAPGTLTVQSDAAGGASMVALSGTGAATPLPGPLQVGGCTIAGEAGAADPTLWLLVALAGAVLALRRRGRRRSA